MAKKGQIFNKYDNYLKNIIIKEKQKGKSYSCLSKEYNISIGTLMTWMHKVNRPELYPIKGKSVVIKKKKI